MLCYFNTPCDARDLPGYSTNESSTKSTSIPGSVPGSWKSPTQSPYAEDDPRLHNFCGSDWDDANKCRIWCPDSDDDKCPYGVFAREVC